MGTDRYYSSREEVQIATEGFDLARNQYSALPQTWREENSAGVAEAYLQMIIICLPLYIKPSTLYYVRMETLSKSSVRKDVGMRKSLGMIIIVTNSKSRTDYVIR